MQKAELSRARKRGMRIAYLQNNWQLYLMLLVPVAFVIIFKYAAYPGLRIKTQPEWAMWILYLSFVLMTVGLYLCFFHVPAAAVVRGDGIALKCPKDAESLEDALREAADGAPRE